MMTLFAAFPACLLNINESKGTEKNNKQAAGDFPAKKERR